MPRKNREVEKIYSNGMADIFRDRIEESQSGFEDNEPEVTKEALQAGKAVADVIGAGGKQVSKFASVVITIIAILVLLAALEIVALLFMPNVGYEILYKINDLWQMRPQRRI